MALPESEVVSGSSGAARVLSTVVTTPVLGWLIFKPIAIFVYGLSHVANRLHFHDRARLSRIVARARGAGQPILFASNHVSMFDDPVVPMALFRMGPRAILDVALLACVVGGAHSAPDGLVSPWILASAVALAAVGLGAFSARKTWWSLGDLVNFSGAAALRAKIAVSDRAPSLFTRALLVVADPTIRAFMRSSIVKTIFVDRRPGDEAKSLRARATDEAVRVASSGDAVWVFLEGGRSREPNTIRPARRGIGEMVKRLDGAGARPLVVVVHQRGMERVMPLGSRRWLTVGHDIDVRWATFDITDAIAEAETQEIADTVRGVLVELQGEYRSGVEGAA